MNGAAHLRPARPADSAALYAICLRTGDTGRDATVFYREDPDALGRIFTEPYLRFEPELATVLEDADGVCGYVLGARDSRAFYARYEAEWRPGLAARFPAPGGDPAGWTRVQQIHHLYHHPDYTCPEPYAAYPSHLHIDLLPRAQGRGWGRRMLEATLARLAESGSPGAHLGVGVGNVPALGFYARLGFRELLRTGGPADGCVYLGRSCR